MATTTDKVCIEKLKGSENYASWKYAIQALLEFSDLEKTILETGTETDATKLKKARAKIILSIESHLYVHIQECTTALTIWQKLMSMFEDKGLTRRIGLLRKLITTTLEGSDSLEEYIGEVIGTANKLSGIGFKIDDEWVGSFLLAGLTDEYKPFIMGIESSGIKIGGDSIKSRLYEIGNIGNKDHERAMYSKKMNRKTDKSKTKNKIKCYECNKTGHKQADCWYRNKNKDSEKKSLATTSNAFSAVLSSHSVSNDIWFVDSGASEHMCASDIGFVNVRKAATQHICTASGEKLKVKHCGDLTLHIDGRDVKVNDVLCVPNIAANLLSISKITEKSNSVSFVKDGCIIRNAKNEIVCKAMLDDGVYRLKVKLPKAMAAKQPQDIQIWHRRLGHLNYNDVLKVTNCGLSSSEKAAIPKCKVCIEAKQPRQPYKSYGNRSKNVLDLIHTDLCGPMETMSIGKAKYFVTFIDDYSRKTYVYFLRSKSETFPAFQEFKAQVENQTGRKIKAMRSDNGREYVNNEMDEFLKKNGIIHQTSTPHSPEQNGLAERMNRTLIERAKSLLFDAGMQKSFWAEAVHTAAYLINRSPATSTGQQPEALWSGKIPNLSHLQIFGTKAMVHIPKVQRRKWDRNSKELIFVGYCDHTKGYRLYDSASRKIIKSRDVIFLNDGNGNRQLVQYSLDSVEAPEEEASSTGDDEKSIDDGDDTENAEDADDTIATENAGEIGNAEISHISVNSSIDDTFSECDDKKNDPDFVPVEASPTTAALRHDKATRSGTSYVTMSAIDVDPMTLDEAMKSEHKNEWVNAMKDELNSLQENGTWALTNLPSGRKAIKTKWVFRRKRDDEGNVIRFKARLVAKGCAQVNGIDYNETFAPVIRYSSIRFLVAFAAKHKMFIDQMDVVTAFLQGDLNEEIYCEQPEGFGDGTSRVCKLKKSMYGLKQSPRQWNLKLDQAIKSIGLIRSKFDPCVYVAKKGNQVNLIISIYVDDFLIFWRNP